LIPDCIFALFVRIVRRGLHLATRFEQKLGALRALSGSTKKAEQPYPSADAMRIFGYLVEQGFLMLPNSK
jgi:hypothetical protein